MKHRILVVDDNESVRRDFQKVLGGADGDGFAQVSAAFFGEIPPPALQPSFEVDYLTQGLDAVDLFRQAYENGAPHSVAFVDVRMPPGIDGLETATRLWQIDSTLQVVICSAYADYSWEEMIARLGYRDRLLILKKPFAGIEVLQLACALTEKWELARQAAQYLKQVDQQIAVRTNALIAANERRKSAEEQLLRAQRLENIGALASGIAHDLNNLLSPILMSTQLLDDGTLPPEQEVLRETIQTAAERAAKIIMQMLAFARGTANEYAALKPDNILREIVQIARETFPSGISVRFQSSPDLPLLRGNTTQLHQVLMNLCVNARDAMPSGGSLLLSAETFTVDKTYASGHPNAEPGDYVLLRVSDTGSGIPEEIREKIFEPFFTTKGPEKGTGLGLSTTVGIVRNHGGFLDVKSVLGQGTTFSIYLPIDPESETIQEPPKAALPPRGNGELILVVDDEKAIRETTAAMLKRHGYRAMTASDGAEAITVLAQGACKFHAVLTDVHMPVLDGPTFVRVLKNMTPHVPVLLITGSAGDTFTQEFKSLGIYEILPKPYRSEQLLTLLHETLMACSACTAAA